MVWQVWIMSGRCVCDFKSVALVWRGVSVVCDVVNSVAVVVVVVVVVVFKVWSWSRRCGYGLGVTVVKKVWL